MSRNDQNYFNSQHVNTLLDMATLTDSKGTYVYLKTRLGEAAVERFIRKANKLIDLVYNQKGFHNSGRDSYSARTSNFSFLSTGISHAYTHKQKW